MLRIDLSQNPSPPAELQHPGSETSFEKASIGVSLVDEKLLE
jgi:hypothetical protein